MRVGTYNMVNQIYGSNGTKKSKTSSNTAHASFKDEIAFSSMGKDMQIAKNALAAVPNTRDNIVSDIKSRMENGTYKVSVDDFAEKLMSAYTTGKVF